ncbi:hypothetical protein BH18CHL2_BH18CHL2_07640 [soil metagenome]
MPVRKIARIVDAALKDAALARRKASDPAFGRDIAKDRRGTLSEFDTVKHALKDRERLERAKAARAAAKRTKPKK